MFNKIRNRKNNKKGFTLIELIIVIAILGILAAILVPSMLNIVNNSKTSVAVANARSLYSVAQSAYVKVSINDDFTATGTFAKGTDNDLMDEIALNLGAGFNEDYSVTVTSSGISTVTYNLQAYAPAAAATP